MCVCSSRLAYLVNIFRPLLPLEHNKKTQSPANPSQAVAPKPAHMIQIEPRMLRNLRVRGHQASPTEHWGNTRSPGNSPFTDKSWL